MPFFVLSTTVKKNVKVRLRQVSTRSRLGRPDRSIEDGWAGALMMKITFQAKV